MSDPVPASADENERCAPPPGCRCRCHRPGMNVSHAAPCCSGVQVIADESERLFERTEVDDLARLLMTEWGRVEGLDAQVLGVTYVATWADLARAVLATNYLSPAEVARIIAAKNRYSVDVIELRAELETYSSPAEVTRREEAAWNLGVRERGEFEKLRGTGNFHMVNPFRASTGGEGS